MTLAGIGDDSVIITMASTPTNYTIAEGATQKVDIDADGVDYDVSITLNSITGSSASLTIKSISEEISPAASSGGGSSATTYTASASQFAEGYTKEMKRNSKIKFSVDRKTHTLTLKSLTDNTATIEIASTPQTAVLEIGALKKFDVTDDGYYDLSVTLDSITSSSASVINSRGAEITIKSLYEKIVIDAEVGDDDAEVVGDETVVDDETSIISEGGKIIISCWRWILAAIVAVIVLIFAGRKSKKKGKKRK